MQLTVMTTTAVSGVAPQILVMVEWPSLRGDTSQSQSHCTRCSVWPNTPTMDWEDKMSCSINKQRNVCGHLPPCPPPPTHHSPLCGPSPSLPPSPLARHLQQTLLQTWGSQYTRLRPIITRLVMIYHQTLGLTITRSLVIHHQIWWDLSPPDWWLIITKKHQSWLWKGPNKGCSCPGLSEINEGAPARTCAPAAPALLVLLHTTIGSFSVPVIPAIVLTVQTYLQRLLSRTA